MIYRFFPRGPVHSERKTCVNVATELSHHWTKKNLSNPGREQKQQKKKSLQFLETSVINLEKKFATVFVAGPDKLRSQGTFYWLKNSRLLLFLRIRLNVVQSITAKDAQKGIISEWNVTLKISISLQFRPQLKVGVRETEKNIEAQSPSELYFERFRAWKKTYFFAKWSCR